MNILYYMGSIGTAQGGLFQYALSLLRLLSADSAHTLHVVYGGSAPEVPEVCAQHPNLHLVPLEDATLRKWFWKMRVAKVLSLLGVTYRPQGPMASIIRKHRIAVVLCPYQDLPPALTVPAITTIHDLQQLIFPENFSPQERIFKETHYSDIIARADVVLSSFEHVRQDILKYYRKPEHQVVAQRIDLTQFFNPTLQVPQDIVPLDTYQLPQHYLLYPAATWPHKNHISLLQAIARLKAQGHIVNLVCTGNHATDMRATLDAFVAEHQLADQVFFLGIVPERALFSLYHACTAVVIPTKYEATSGPLVEAISYGIPVICSNVTALPETMGDARFLFAPEDIPEMAEIIRKIYADPLFRQENLAAIHQQKSNLALPDSSARFKQVLDLACANFKAKSA